MLSHTIESTPHSLAAVDLPLSYIFLTEWVLVRLQGTDVIQFAHNQFTCDIKKLNKNQYVFAAHCNPQGRMISNMYVFHIKNQGEIAFIQKKNICDKQIEAMKKYAVFSKINIIPDYNIQIIGIAGKNAKQYLNIFFSNIPNSAHSIVHTSNATLLYFNKPTERFLLITNDKLLLNHLLNQSKFDIHINNNDQWTALDIEAGYPWIEFSTSEIFIPQAVNMDILQGISFNKGCYIGQELITRIQYRGGNKKTLFRLINNITPNIHIKNNLPKPGEHLKIEIKNKNEKYIGTVLQAAQIKKYNTWIQIVLNKTILQHLQKNSIIKTIQTNNNYILLS